MDCTVKVSKMLHEGNNSERVSPFPMSLPSMSLSVAVRSLITSTASPSQRLCFFLLALHHITLKYPALGTLGGVSGTFPEDPAFPTGVWGEEP